MPTDTPSPSSPPSRTVAPGRHRLPFVVIMTTLALDAIGLGIVLPVLPDLLQEVSGSDLAHAALWGGVLTTSFAVMQFLCGPIVGNLSDRFGRRTVLIASLAVMTVDYLVMAVAGSIWLLLGARILAGMAAANFATAAAYIADISPPERKGSNFGLIGAAFGLGLIVGPAVGGLLGEFGTRLPFWVTAGICAANMALAIFVLPETLSADRRRRFEWRRANPFGAFRSIGRLPGVRRILLLFFVYEFATFVYPATWAYFTAARFGWPPGMIGLSLAIFGISFAVVQGGLIRVLHARIGNRATVLFGLAMNALAFTVLGLITDGFIALFLLPLSALGAVVAPTLQGIMSRIAEDNQQGELQGVIASAKAMAMITSPLTMTSVFWLFTGPAAPVYLPGAAFLLSLGLMAICLWLFLGSRAAARVA